MQESRHQAFINVATQLQCHWARHVCQHNHSQIPKVKPRAWPREQKNLKAIEKRDIPQLTSFLLLGILLIIETARWLQALKITLCNRGWAKNVDLWLFRRQLPRLWKNPSISDALPPCYMPSPLTLNEDGTKRGGMIFKSVSSVTWSAVLVNRFDGQENRNHLLKMSFRDILWISIIYAASVLSFITEKLEPP